MTREITNIIRYVLDSILPPVLRDNRYFMYPMFFLWYKGKNVRKLMDFKSRVEELSEEEYIAYYKIYESLPNRDTDLNKKSISFIFDNIGINKDIKILDIGCGNGYLLEKLKERDFNNLTGCDIVN